MIASRGTGATRVSFRKPNCRSHSRPIPEKIDENSIDMPTTPGAMNWSELPMPARWNIATKPKPNTRR